MGFFKSIGKSFNQITRAVIKPVEQLVHNPVKVITSLPKTVGLVAQEAINNPVRFSLAAISGGLSEVAREAPLIGSIYKQGTQLASEGLKIGSNIYTGGLYGAGSNIGNQFANQLVNRGDNMALNIGNILQQASGLFGSGGGASNPYFQTTSGVLGLASQFFPQPRAFPAVMPPFQPQQVMSAVPAVIGGAGRMLPSIGRSMFRRFPNLAVSLNALRLAGKGVKRSQLYSMMKRFGPEFLVTGGILSAAAVTELAMAGPGRRRMNAANPKALRRAAGRIRSFHKMCGTIDLLKGRSVRKKSRC